jgi:dsRNA-specific ribonuclease
LIKHFPNDGPGDISFKKSSIVCNKALALVTLHYRLHRFLLHDQIDINKAHINTIQELERRWDEYYNDLQAMYTNEPTVFIR